MLAVELTKLCVLLQGMGLENPTEYLAKVFRELREMMEAEYKRNPNQILKIGFYVEKVEKA